MFLARIEEHKVHDFGLSARFELRQDRFYAIVALFAQTMP